MKLFYTILFGVVLTTVAPASSTISIADFFTSQYKEFCIRLQTWIDASPNDLLPFMFSRNVIQDLNYVSAEFIDFMIKTESELSKSHGTLAAVAAFKKTIDVIFKSIGNRTKSKKSADMLKQIKLVDPLGLDAFLQRINKQIEGKFEIDDVIIQFLELMADRLLLLNCKENPSIIRDPAYNAGGKMSSIPEWIRKELATEDAAISEGTINYFLDIAARQFNKAKIYHIKNDKVHDSNGSDGLRILFGGRIGSNKVPNWLCIRYNAYTKKLYVYDNVQSHLKESVAAIRESIIHKQFPEKSLPISYDKSKTPSAEPESSGIYAMIYACTSLMGEDPSKIKFKLNYVYGDKSLYMRLHLLKVLANKRLAAMD